MSGDVVANLDAIPGSPIGMAAAMNGGIPPAIGPHFPSDGTSLHRPPPAPRCATP